MTQSPVRSVPPPFMNRRRHVLMALTVLLLVSLACGLPKLGGTPPTPTRPATASAQAATPRMGIAGTAAPAGQTPRAQVTPGERFPPALVEVEPLPQSPMGPGTAPVFYFNQPMERASVEAAFMTQPSQPGRLDWMDDSTLRFTPDQPLQTAAGLTVTIQTGARAANGLPLAQPVQVHYLAPGKMRAAERLPAPGAQEVSPASAVVVTFTHPVVALGADPQRLPAAFKLEPAAGGRGEWVNTSTYIFYPQPALMGGKRYTVQLDTRLTSVDGSPLEPIAGQEWSFTTAAPALLSVKPSPDQPMALDSALTLAFNQPMDAPGVEANFSLLDPGGSPVAGKFQWDSAGSEMTFQPHQLLERGKVYTLALFGAAPSLGGTPLGKDFAAALTTVPQFALTQTRPAAGEMLTAYGGFGSVMLSFSSPVAAGQDLNRLIQFNPPVAGQTVYRDPQGLQLMASGYFQPSTRYTLSVSGEIHDRWGAALGAPFSFTFNSQEANPELVIPVRQAGAAALFVPQNETGLPARLTNLNRINLSRGELGLAEFIQAAAGGNGLANWEARVQASWPLLVYPPPNVSEAVTLPLAQDGQPLAPGLYFLALDPQPAPVDQAPRAPELVVVSPIQMVLKTSSRQASIWAVHVPENTPAAQAQVTVLDSDAVPLGSCITDDQGLCQVRFAPRQDPNKPIFAVRGQPGDPDFSLAASNWNGGVAPWDYGVNFGDKGAQPEIYLYTDRPIYRPGQAVNLRVIARAQDNGRYANPALNQVTVDVVSPYDAATGQTQVLTSLRLALDPFGAAAGVYTLPENARTGSYTLRVQEVPFKEMNFEVAEYRKPEIDLQVQFSRPGELVGQDVSAQVTARYFFGAPAGNLKVHWSLFRQPGVLQLPGGLHAGKVDTGWLQPWHFPGSAADLYLLEGETQTGPDGKAVIAFSGQELQERLDSAASQMQTLKLEVTVTDASGLPVAARAALPLHPSPFYIGARAEQWTGTAGEELSYQVRSVDWQGSPVGDRPLSAHFRKVVWQQPEGASPAALPEIQAQYTEAGSTDFQTSPQGEARLAFTPPEPGTYLLEIRGAQGAVTQVLTWVSGAGTAPWPELTNQHILLHSDHESYQPGQTAHIFVPNPYPQGAQAWVTVERARVMRSWVVQIEGSSYDLQVPLTGEDAPNIFVSVTLLGRVDNRPDFRQGYLELAVDPAAQALKVAIQASPQQPQPGEQLTLQIQARDAANQPVAGEFSLALIDKAVLALADPNSPAILEAFYGKQPLGVQNGLSLAVYAGRLLLLPPGRGGGGGGDLAGEHAVRSQFADTAYWNAAVTTGADGLAQVAFQLPDNLTTWVAEVRGLTQDTRVGQAALELVTSRPLLIRPVTPRFVAPGDHLELAAVVHNNTPETLATSVRLEGSGFSLDDLNQAAQPVELKAGEQRRVSWWGTVQDVAALDLTFAVEAGALRDAARPAQGSLPVLRYTAPQSFGTSGVLAQPGERLELVSLPRSFTPSGAELHLELSPSLSAVVVDGLRALESYPYDFTEPILSRLLPNLAAGQAWKDWQVEDQALRGALQQTVSDSAGRLVHLQNEDGGWGWAAGYPSDAYLTSYVLLGLSRAGQSGVRVAPAVLQKAQDYLRAQVWTPAAHNETWQLDRLAFQFFALRQSGQTDLNLAPLYDLRDQLSPGGKAFLALALHAQKAGDPRARTLISDLQSTASRSAGGAHWQDAGPVWRNWSTPNFTTAVVVYAMAQIDPASPLLSDVVRYLVLNRRSNGAWASSYETAWVLMALTETARATGDWQAQYAYSAALNAAPLMEGRVENPAQALNAVNSTTALSGLRADGPNALRIQRGAGSGSLYYRAYLRVSRPAQEALPIQRGLSLTRQYYLAGQDCRKTVCQPVDSAELSNPLPLQVRLTLTLPEDLYSVVVEDTLPAGTEALNPRLKTSQQNSVAGAGDGAQAALPYNLENPFSQGWGWWWFNDPQVYDDHIRWVVDYLPAGTYELTYRLTPFLAGEFQVIPAHAWTYYFPEVEATSQGSVFKIK